MNVIEGACVGHDLLSAMAMLRRQPTMGKLLHLDKRGRHARVKPVPSGGAQIFLFTGVRYERDGTPVPNKPIGSPARTKRKRG